MFEVKAKQKDKVILFGVEYEYRRPVVADAKLLSKMQMKDTSDADKVDLAIEFLVRIGFPKEAVEQLDFEEFSQLVTLVSAKEKKS